MDTGTNRAQRSIKILLRGWFITTLPFDVNLICSLCSNRQDVDLGSVTDLSLCFFVFCFSAVSLLFPFNRTEEKIFQFQFHHAGDVAVSCGGKKKSVSVSRHILYTPLQNCFFVCGIVVFLWLVLNEKYPSILSFQYAPDLNRKWLFSWTAYFSEAKFLFFYSSQKYILFCVTDCIRFGIVLLDIIVI